MSERITSITKDNYQDVVNNAKFLRQKFRDHHAEHGGFPSLRWASENWGFPLSLKAMFRHRQAVADELNVQIGSPTHVLPRPKKKKDEPSAEREVATVETIQEEVSTETAETPIQ